MKLKNEIKKYIPFNEQEKKDKEVILKWMEHAQDMFNRENQIAHFCTSAWVLNAEKNKVLMIYHNIYQSWSWPGGHADGEEDLLKVAIKEVQEETGVQEVIPLKEDIFSLELLTLDASNLSKIKSKNSLNRTYSVTLHIV